MRPLLPLLLLVAACGGREDAPRDAPPDAAPDVVDAAPDAADAALDDDAPACVEAGDCTYGGTPITCTGDIAPPDGCGGPVVAQCGVPIVVLYCCTPEAGPTLPPAEACPP